MNHSSQAGAELRRELQKLLNLLRQHIENQRQAGRTPETDALRGMAIEEGEAERIVRALYVELSSPAGVQSDAEISPWLEILPPDPQETPLRRAKRLFQLESPEWNALLFALAVEMDSRFARLAAFLNDHIARTRPTIGLCLVISKAASNAVEFSQRPALRFGLLQTEGEGPLSGLALRLPHEMLGRLASGAAEFPLPTGIRLRCDPTLQLENLIVDSVQRVTLGAWSSRLRRGRLEPPLLLVGPEGGGRGTAAVAAAASAGYGLVELCWSAERPQLLRVAAREALWHRAVLLVRVGEGASREDLAGLWSELFLWNLPVALALPPSLVELVRSVSSVEPVVIQLEPLDSAQRQMLWQRLLPPEAAQLNGSEREDLAARYDFLPGQIARALRSAQAQRSLAEEGTPLDFEALACACRAIGRGGMGPIAQRLSQPYRREDLVLPTDLEEELDLARSWMKHRRRVFEEWGFGRRIAQGQGLTALFSGDPGTGKTMAAQVMARDLGQELYRVDLSRVMSKYIGETEKNLSRLFDDARASGAILFFDEADVLFGKRSEVKDAHDRYANLEIGYLLQRMEEHVGTTILATNRMRDLDEAFTRRFHFILDFPLPSPPERRRIWAGMLPPEALKDQEIDLEQLAENYEISGGEIRNSVIIAAFMAASEGVPISLRHLRRGLRRELLKVGRVLDSHQRRELEQC